MLSQIKNCHFWRFKNQIFTSSWQKLEISKIKANLLLEWFIRSKFDRKIYKKYSNATQFCLWTVPNLEPVTGYPSLIIEPDSRFELLWNNSKLAGLEEVSAYFRNNLFCPTTYYASHNFNQDYHLLNQDSC